MDDPPHWMKRLFGRNAEKQANTERPTRPPAATPNSADDAPASSLWKIGEVIRSQSEEYTVITQLGQGGMGIVYKVHYRRWNREMAVKSPRPEVFARAGGKERFIREAETWVKLGEHPHIVRCDFVRVVGGIPRIFAEYVPGGSLAEWVRDRRLYAGGSKAALARILDVAIQCAWGLHYAHEQGIVHQDVKPANVMMIPQGLAKVTDFGLAQARASVETSTLHQAAGHSIVVPGVGLMTPEYASPEQIQGQPLTRKTDLWSWGVSLLELFVGEVTWSTGVVAGAVLTSYVEQRTKDPTLPLMPTRVVRLLEHCFQYDPAQRPATLQEVAATLQICYQDILGVPYPRQMPTSTTRGAHIWSNRGLSLRELKQPQEALAAYEQAIRLDPHNADTYNGKGLVLQDLKRPQEALAAYEQALRLDAHVAYIYFNQGNVLRELRRPQEAFAAYEQAIRLDPHDADAYYSQGVVLIDLQRPQEALAAYEQAIRLDPSYARAYYAKGSVLRELKRPQEALAAQEQALRLDPHSANTYTAKGKVLRELKRHKEALAAYEQALRFDPHSANTYTAKGAVLHDLKRHKEALAAYEQALRLNPHSAYAYHGKGMVLRTLGRTREAAAAERQARVLEES